MDKQIQTFLKYERIYSWISSTFKNYSNVLIDCKSSYTLMEKSNAFSVFSELWK